VCNARFDAFYDSSMWFLLTTQIRKMTMGNKLIKNLEAVAHANIRRDPLNYQLLYNCRFYLGYLHCK